MSYEINGLSPQESYEVGYDTGFDHGKPYWEGKYQDRIVEAVSQNITLQLALSPEQMVYLIEIIQAVAPADILKGENK